jgi:hypothetical protein
MATESEDTPGSSPERRPTKGLPVQVQCEGFRCMAYQDENGNWIDSHTGKRLTGNVYQVE